MRRLPNRTSGERDANQPQARDQTELSVPNATNTLNAGEAEQYQDSLAIQRVLNTAKTIAIVGLSNNELRASYFVGYYLKRHGYRVIPVNPRATEILGETSYASLLDVPEPVDIVNVFRAPDALPEIAQQTVQIGAGALWCQFGVINETGARTAEDGGATVIMDRCIKVEHARFHGGLHLLGFDTGQITARKTVR